MTIQLRKQIKFKKDTVPKDSSGVVRGVSNSPFIFNNFRGGDSAGDWFYLVEFPIFGEIAVLTSEANIV